MLKHQLPSITFSQNFQTIAWCSLFIPWLLSFWDCSGSAPPAPAQNLEVTHLVKLKWYLLTGGRYIVRQGSDSVFGHCLPESALIPKGISQAPVCFPDCTPKCMNSDPLPLFDLFCSHLGIFHKKTCALAKKTTDLSASYHGGHVGAFFGCLEVAFQCRQAVEDFAGTLFGFRGFQTVSNVCQTLPWLLSSQGLLNWPENVPWKRVFPSKSLRPRQQPKHSAAKT